MSEQKDADIYNTDNEFIKISRNDGDITIGKDTVGSDYKSGWCLEEDYQHVPPSNLPPDITFSNNDVKNTYFTFIPQAGKFDDFQLDHSKAYIRKDPSLIFDIKPINSRWYPPVLKHRPGGFVHGSSLEFRGGLVSDITDNGSGFLNLGGAYGGDIRFITGLGYCGEQLTTPPIEKYHSGAIRFYIRGNKKSTNTKNDKDTFNEVMTINKNGYVGIGTTQPRYPLDVVGSVQNDLAAERTGSTTANGIGMWWYYTDNLYGGTTKDYTHPNVSIRASEGIMCPGLWNYSDKRIKTEITNIDDGKALMQINQLESKEYHYIDPMRRKKMKTIGFIAQEVKEIIPNAVGKITQFVPDEMRRILDPQWDSNVLTIPDLDMSNNNFTGKCKFYVRNDLSGNDEVCKEIECEKDASGNNTNHFRFEQKFANIFFHGKEVDDFHIIDKNQIFALHHSAIQELSRNNDAKTEKMQALEAKYSLLESENQQLKSDIAIIKNKLGL